MRPTGRRYRNTELLIAGLLAVLAFLAHAPFFKAAPGILDGNFGNANFPLFGALTDYFRDGHWTPFTFQLGYGGTYVAAARSLWMSLVNLFVAETPRSHVQAAVAFNYGVMPALIAVLTYWMSRAYVGRIAAVLTAVLVIVDFQSNLLDAYGTDYYFGYLIPGFLFLMMRARMGNPFRQLTGRGLFVAGLISGAGIYVCRAAMIPVVVFWVPWDSAWPALRSAFRRDRGAIRMVKWAFWAVMGLGAYLELFGADLGAIHGRQVYLDAGPNWNIAALLLGILLAYDLRASFSLPDVKRVLIIAGGFVVGFFPDLWEQIVVQRHFPGLGTNTYSQSLEKSLWVMSQLPSRFRALVSGNPESLLSVVSVVLGLCAVAALARSARRERKFLPALVYLILSVGAFIRLRSTSSSEAPLTYLVPVLPALYLGYACLFERACELARGSRAAKTLAAVVVASLGVHLATQWDSHLAFAKQIDQSGDVEQAWRIVDEFRKEGVDVVICDDDVLRCLQYGFFSRSKPVFAYARTTVESYEAGEAIRRAQTMGIVSRSAGLRGKVEYRGYAWDVTGAIGRQGDRYLFVGERKE